MKVKKIEQTDEQFVKEHKSKLKDYLELCKYDVVPISLVGSIVTKYSAQLYSSDGILDVVLFGGVVGAAFALAVNGVITGVRASKQERNRIKEQILNKDESTGKKL